jgi:nucleoside phosphorylase
MDNSIDIVVISALKEELKFLFDKKELNWCDLTELNYLSCKIGTLLLPNSERPIRIAAAYADGMGLVDAAILTTTAIVSCQQKPKLLAMIGICGGRKKEGSNYGDIVVPELTYLYQFGSYENGEINRRLKTAEVKRSSKLIRAMKDCLNNPMLEDIRRSAIHLSADDSGINIPKNPFLKVHFDPMGTADLVVKDDKKIDDATDAEEKVVAVEMESYAVLRTATVFDVDAIVIKSISDFCGGKDDTYRKYAKFTATEAFYRFVKYLAEKQNFFLT